MLILFIMPLNWREGGGREGAFFLNSEFLLFSFDALHLQIIASIPPKACVQNSSAQWAIFFQSTLLLAYNIRITR